MTSIGIGPTTTPALQWEDIDDEGDVLFLRRGDRMVGEVYPRGEGYRWHCRVSDRREMASNIDAAQKALIRCVQHALRMENGAGNYEFLHYLMVEADRPGRERVYALLLAASEYLRPGREREADATLVADPSRVATELESIASLEEAKTSQRDDALVTDLREVASLVWGEISQRVSA